MRVCDNDTATSILKMRHRAWYDNSWAVLAGVLVFAAYGVPPLLWLVGHVFGWLYYAVVYPWWNYWLCPY